MRLFVAVNLPADVRRAAWQAAAPLRAADLPVKWVGEDGLHITLKFLGDVDGGRLAEVGAALEQACAGARSFPLEVGGFGAFPTDDRARVLWLGCEAAPPLELLQDALERAFAAIGFPVEGRPFRPHVTIGRARKDLRSGVRGAGSLLADLAYADAFTVDSIDLMESTLTPAGARYSVRKAVPLT